MPVNYVGDLKSMLQKRVTEIRDQKQTLTATLKDLDAQEAAFLRALEMESRRAVSEVKQPEPGQMTLLRDVPVPGPSDRVFSPGPADLVLEVLSDGKARSLAEIKAAAEEKKVYVPEGQSLGRMIHGALIGLLSGKKVDMVDRGVWRLKQNTPPADAEGVFK